MRHVLTYVDSLARDDAGAQVIEYALLIGVVALSLVISLRELTDSDGGFTQFITRAVTCLTTSTCT
jgi:pilus assembly protein Flp/PilA